MKLATNNVTTEDIERTFLESTSYFRKVVLNCVYDPFEREDVLQEAFVGAMESADRYKGNVPLKSWLRGIVCNTASNFNRRRSRRIQRESLTGLGIGDEWDMGVEGIPSYEFVDAPKRQPLGVIGERERHELELRLERMVEQMDPQGRDIIEMRTYQGRPYADISNASGEIPLSTLKNRHHAAIRKLRDAITEDERALVG